MLQRFEQIDRLAAARVTTMRLPASTDLPGSITLPAHSREDFAGAGIPEEFGDLMAEFAGLSGGADFFRAKVFGRRRANDGVHDELASLNARPGAERNLAATLKGR